MSVRDEVKHSILWSSYRAPLRHACRILKPKSVLEWGPGASTELIANECPDAEILTIEHKATYAERIERIVQDNPRIQVVHRVLSMGGGRSTGYVTEPLWHSRKWDLIFVDGRQRVDCLMLSRQLLASGGIVLLHDAHRNAYQRGLEFYPHRWSSERLRTAAASTMPKPIRVMEGFDDSPQPNTLLSDSDTISELRRRFLSGDRFFYTRFGDADLLFMGDPEFAGNKRHDNSRELSRELVEAFMIDSPGFLIGCVGGSRIFRKSHQGNLNDIASTLHEGRTHYSAVALMMSYRERPDEFISFCRGCFGGRRVLLVGGESVCRNELVRSVLNVTGTIEFTDTNAYSMLDSQMGRIQKNVAKYDVMIAALGQAGRVLAKRLWNDGLRDIQYFDIGSVIDALAERPLRSWITKHSEQVEVYRSAFAD